MGSPTCVTSIRRSRLLSSDCVVGIRLAVSLRQASAALASSGRSWAGTESGAGRAPATAVDRQARLCRQK